MKCPRCKNSQGYKYLEEYRLWFFCPICELRCLMKEYSDKFKGKDV